MLAMCLWWLLRVFVPVVLLAGGTLTHKCDPSPPPPPSTSSVLHLEYLYVLVVVERGGLYPGVKCCMLASLSVAVIQFFCVCV